MENSGGHQVLHNLSQLLTAIKDSPELSEAFQSSSAPRLIEDFLRSNANIATNQVVSSELHGTAVRRSEAGQRAMDEVLENDLILELIFSYCAFNSLKACRLVSRRWLDMSLKAWRNEAVLWVPENDIEPGPDTMRLCKLSNIIETIKAGGKDTHLLLQKPFSSYNLDWFSWLFRKDDIDSPNYQTFLEQFQSHTTYLDLGRLAAGNTRELIALLFSRFPQLTHVVFKDVYLWCSYTSGDFANVRPHENIRVFEMREILFTRSFSWIDFLRQLPQLRKLVLGFAVDDEEDDDGENKSKEQLEAVLRVIGSLRAESEQVLNLKELDILRIHAYPIREVGRDTPALLQQCKLGLEWFSVDLGAKTDTSCNSDLLAPFTSTLKVLRLTRGLDESCYGYVTSKRWSLEALRKMVAATRIRLEKLEELRLLNGPCWGFHLLSYLEAPMLNTLVFESHIACIKETDSAALRSADQNFHEAGVIYAFLEHKVFPNLVTLDYEHEWNLLGSKDLHALASAMPNLKNLSVPLNSLTFKDVCKLWPGLRSLEVRKCDGDFPEVDDRAITGFVGLEGGSALPPNITDLKGLKDFIISCERTLKREDVKFTDQSVYHGFLKWPRLHYLSIAFKQISEKAKTALEDHVHYVHYQTPKK